MTIRFKIFKGPQKKGKQRKASQTRTTLFVRIRDGRGVDQTARTHILINPEWWDQRIEEISCLSNCPENERNEINAGIDYLRSYIATNYVIDRINGRINCTWLRDTLEKNRKNSEGDEGIDFHIVFKEFMERHEVSEVRLKQYQVLGRIMDRYESYMKYINKLNTNVFIDITKTTVKTLESIWTYLRNEHRYYLESPEAFAMFPQMKSPKPRSMNTMNDIFKKLRAFFKWCVDEGILEKSPFEKFRIPGEVYGTPIYLSHEELKIVETYNFKKCPRLERQRDIFIFQCNIGCRVGDLIRLKKSDVSNGVVTFIPHKTQNERPVMLTVPLNSTARSIVEKYAKRPKESLLPFISVQKYNDAIKEILTVAGITRTVAVLDPLTRCDKKVRLCDIASSHMARRTFAGNLYQKVKDPALIASLTGHVEGSKAFSRYRAIDENLKKEMVSMLD